MLLPRNVVALTLASLIGFGQVNGQQRAFNKQRVTYTSDGLTLVGFVYKPDGPGPFPTVVWNHGSEKNPDADPQFDSVAAIFVPAGYVVFAPTRRGHGASEGTYITDLLDALQEKGDFRGANRLMVRLLETEQLEDQFAGIAYAKSLPFIDTSRMVVAGCSFGGIQSLLAAERDGAFKAALPISPAALTWTRSESVRNRLIASVSAIAIPVRLIQPPKDASLEPARVLGEEAKKLGKASFTINIYPTTMPEDEQTHCFGGFKGFHNFGEEAVAFFDSVLAPR